MHWDEPCISLSLIPVVPIDMKLGICPVCIDNNLQLTENISLASRVIREEIGTVLAEDIQAQLEETGQSIDDFVE